ncbi:arsenate reductase/protein-tyrosine-phosphatase family protein [Arthrobacter oryzae]|uniref:arsenate reductase/protein-tyrosine-phosphatase family protein n=1 Tax=Arthrobacter oryzae TaxID=409290 RepID=UPI0027D88FAE|nr:hypothetical protein [Arthrobacter oryzae]
MVCTANICRSPYAAAVLGARLSRLPGQPGFQVTSAGTKAIRDAGLCSEAASLLSGERVTGESPAHASSLVDDSAIDSADLVLVMELAHRSAVALISPSARQRTFTLREAARLAQHVQLGPRPDSSDHDAPGDVRFREFVEELNSLRGDARLTAPAAGPWWKRTSSRGIDPLDIPDGHNSTNRQHKAVLAQVGEATENIAADLTRLFA